MIDAKRRQEVIELALSFLSARLDDANHSFALSDAQLDQLGDGSESDLLLVRSRIVDTVEEVEVEEILAELTDHDGVEFKPNE